MCELTDLEIIKRIADIEGFDFTLANNTIQAKPFTVTDTFDCCHMGFTFNPLTDDGLCFRLMVKYKVDVDFTGDGYTRAWQYDHNDGQETLGKNPNKVICLAIIEASK